MTPIAAVCMFFLEVCQKTEQVANGPHLLLSCISIVTKVYIVPKKLSHPLKQGLIEIVPTLISISNLKL